LAGQRQRGERVKGSREKENQPIIRYVEKGKGGAKLWMEQEYHEGRHKTRGERGRGHEDAE